MDGASPKCVLDNPGYGSKRDTPVEECRDGNLVCRIQDGRCRATGFKRCRCQRQAGKAGLVRCLELQQTMLNQIEAAGTRGNAVRPAQSVADRNAHIRIAQLRQHGTVVVLYQRVHQ